MRTPLNIVPLSPEMEYAMTAASAEDGGHCAPLATHVFLRDLEIVGAAALCAPVITFWAHSKKLHPRESLELAQRCTAKAGELHKHFLAACSPDSPFWHLMPKLGYRRIGNADFFQPIK